MSRRRGFDGPFRPSFLGIYKKKENIFTKKKPIISGLSKNKRTRKRLRATTKEQAIKESQRYSRIASAEEMEAFTTNIATQKRIIKDESSPYIDEVWKIFQNSKMRQPCGENHLKQLKSYWKHFCQNIPSNIEKMNQLTETHANVYFSSMNFKPSAFNYRLKALRMIWKIICWDSVNIFSRIQFQKVIKNSKKYFTEKQVYNILKAVDSTYPFSILHREEMSKLFRIALYTGMRLKCCCLLEWKDVKESTLELTPFKTMRHNRKVIIPIHEQLRKVLGKNQKSGYVLPEIANRYKYNPTGVDITACRIIWFAVNNQALHKHPKNGQLVLPERNKDYGFHSFRHTFVSFCANAGIPLDVVKDIVGHGSTSVTRIYTHFSNETRQKILNALPTGQILIDQPTQSEESAEDLKRKLAQSLGIDPTKLDKLLDLIK